MASFVASATILFATCAQIAHGYKSVVLAHSVQTANASTALSDTPVTRVVNMLKDMKDTLTKEMEEDESLYGQMACWCNDNEWEKSQEIKDLESKSADLTSTIDSLTAESSELDLALKQLAKDIAADKDALAEATALREKQAKEFHMEDLNATQALEAVRAALEVLSKHHDEALPQLSTSFLAMRSRGWFDAPAHPSIALASSESSVQSGSWTATQTAIVQRAFQEATSFLNARGGHSQEYYPPYAAQSDEVVGILKELQEQMEADLSEAQRTENEQAALFERLRAEKTEQMKLAEQEEEAKEDRFATAKLDLAEAKEDLEQTEAELAEANTFMANLKTTCADASSNFDGRKTVRQEEITAVEEAIEILMGDEARDAMTATFASSFLQFGASRSSRGERKKAAAVLRAAAEQSSNPALSILATRTELDSFTKVKEAIDKMVLALKQEQADEVKKNDWCNSAIHENEMTTAETETKKSDFVAKGEALDSTISTLGEELESAKAEILRLQVDLQRATENRQKANLEFQQTVADQRTVEAALKEALHRLSIFYDQRGLFLQRGRGVQTPPVPQKTYEPHKGANSVMEMIGTLIQDAKRLQDESLKGETEAQAQYEAVVADTNASVATLQKQVATKTKEKADTEKAKIDNDADVQATVDDLEGLSKDNANLHGECDFLLKNFDTRQEARSQEIEALQQAKQILDGANLS